MLNHRDLRYAARNLARTPTVLAIATLSLGLGVGVNTTLYSAFRAVFLRPPTAHAPERLVRIEPGNSNQMAVPNLRELAAGEAFEGLTAYAVTRLNIRSGADVEQVLALAVSPEFFAVVGLQPAIGRATASGEESVVITHQFWRRRLADRTDPIGAVVTLNGRSFTVVGMLPEGHRAITGSLSPDLYVPITEPLTPGFTDRRRAFVTLVGRLRPGVSIERARAALTPQLQALERMHPEANAGLSSRIFLFPVAGLASWQTRDMPTAALVGVAAVPFAIFALVLGIACANVAALLLARGAARRREIAIRLALGASRAQVFGTLLAESLVLAALGAAVGLALTFWASGGIRALLPAAVAGMVDVAPDATVLGYSLCLVVVVTIACGALPALASTRPRLTDAMRQDRASWQPVGSRSVLVVGQVGVATLMLFLSFLVLRSASAMRAVDPGFLIDDVVTATITPDPAIAVGAERSRVATEALTAVRALPGVTFASLTSMIPLSGDVVSRDYAAGGAGATRRDAYEMHVGPEYFRTMGIGLRHGREFTASDRTGAPDVAVVNRAFVAAHGLDGDPLGIRLHSSDQEPMTIVGVVDDSKYALFGERPRPIVYRSFLQAGGRIILVARGAAGPARLVPELKQALTRLAPHARVEVATMRDATRLESSARQIGWWILGGLGMLGLGLALIGLYGLMSYKVITHSRELGIRLALGASRRQAQGFILRSAAALVGTGAVIGTAAALILTRPLAFLFTGTSPVDPWVVAATGALVLGTGLAASYVPSLRATRVDPMAALRAE